MAGLIIRTTGLEQYAPGGSARIKGLIIAGPGVGKTRWSSYFPKPIYANVENGLASIADRVAPYANIPEPSSGMSPSQAMMAFLEGLEVECRKPNADRQFQTCIVDTLDAFQRKLQDEWLRAHPHEQSFKGFEAWNYMDDKMKMLMTRLLNLDMNVLVLVHHTDKMITEGSGNDAVTHREYGLQLQGSSKDRVFNDFDLVGWMETYYAAVEGKRQQLRRITFQPTPDKPFLKDRLNATPAWLPVTFSDEDYASLFASIVARVDGLKEGEEIGVFAEATEFGGSVTPPTDGGALDPVSPIEDREIPLESMDKVTLTRVARDLNIKVPGNMLKGEIITAINEAREKASEPAVEEPKPEEPKAEEPEAGESKTVDTEAGAVNPNTGEVVADPPTEAEAIQNVVSGIPGSEVVRAPAEEPTEKKIHHCEVCNKDLSGENKDLLQLAWIKTRKKLCNDDFAKQRTS